MGIINHTILFKKSISMYALRICRLLCSGMLMPLRVAYVVTVLPMCRNKQSISTMRNIDNNSIDPALNHLVSIV